MFHYLSFDYSLYYVQGINLDSNIRLYNDIFDTKGPAYYFFIIILKKIFGSGIFQSYLTLCLTVFFFFFSIYFILYKKNKRHFFLIFLFCISILHQQNVNISLSLFQMTFQLFSFYFLFKSYEKKSYLFFSYSIFFLSISCLTRIDGLIYLPVFFLFLLFLPSLKDRIKYLIITILIFLICYLFFSFYFKFSFQDFWIHNFRVSIAQENWNILWGREPFLKIFNSPYHIYLLMLTGIGPLFFDIFSKKIDETLNNFKEIKKFYEENKIIIIESSIILCGFFGWLYSGTDKNYHVFILFLPLIFFICFNSEYLNKLNFKRYFYYVLFSFFFLITLYPDVKNVIVKRCWSLNLDCKNKQYVKIVDEIIQLKKSAPDYDLFIIGGDGWIHLYSNSKINKSIANELIYISQSTNNKKSDLNLPISLRNVHSKLMRKNKGFIFWINKSLINLNKNKDSVLTSQSFNEIMKISKKISEDDHFIKYKIIK